jgi:excisionase family DNA binding protein
MDATRWFPAVSPLQGCRFMSNEYVLFPTISEVLDGQLADAFGSAVPKYVSQTRNLLALTKKARRPYTQKHSDNTRSWSPPMIKADPSKLVFENQVMTVKEVSALLQLSTKTVYKMARLGAVPCKKMGDTYRVG